MRTEELRQEVSFEDPEQSAAAAGLRYVSDDSPGISRKNRGSGFTYYGPEGKLIKNPAELQRIRALVIPPAWKKVWICPRSNGHLQATGLDAKGRKQYRYHADWRKVREAAKYEHVMSFAHALPGIRARVEHDLKLPGLCREKVLATIVRLLELSLIRIGNDEYAKANQSFGLTTMRNRHVEIAGSTLLFDFRGKSGKQHKVAVSDRRLARIVRKCQELPGQRLFEYQDSDGKPAVVCSDDVNEYLQSITGQPFSAKDFRTWAGTVLAAIALNQMEEVDSKAAAKKNVVTAVAAVSRMLGNTAAICRKCYIHPAVIMKYLDGSLARALRVKADSEISEHLHDLKPEEAAVLALLREELDRRSDSVRD
ncbi:MAG: DNA topoisomerase IB [Verrucomicrobia bacterium]|nr:DNA topoisomerase IB [Verrucomicrobiota bacterium]